MATPTAHIGTFEKYNFLINGEVSAMIPSEYVPLIDCDSHIRLNPM